MWNVGVIYLFVLLFNHNNFLLTTQKSFWGIHFWVKATRWKTNTQSGWFPASLYDCLKGKYNGHINRSLKFYLKSRTTQCTAFASRTHIDRLFTWLCFHFKVLTRNVSGRKEFQCITFFYCLLSLHGNWTLWRGSPWRWLKWCKVCMGKTRM